MHLIKRLFSSVKPTELFELGTIAVIVKQIDGIFIQNNERDCLMKCKSPQDLLILLTTYESFTPLSLVRTLKNLIFLMNEELWNDFKHFTTKHNFSYEKQFHTYEVSFKVKEILKLMKSLILKESCNLHEDVLSTYLQGINCFGESLDFENTNNFMRQRDYYYTGEIDTFI